ncbi:hypothetical protein [Rhizobium fabae]|uniref:Peptidase n=2 Tax=Rhizobium fabae TaxID=573179 RepID=A0A7W6B9V5_9HYPH|nr:hypothetical protein [Rhizobium fabae]MBB3918428.1 hypothetical protein [Rhizobium fabae]
MMSTHERIGRPDIAWSAEGAGSGGGEPENILFPADVPQQRTDGGEGYQADPGKADGENALAKAERDGEGEAARGEADRVPEDGKYTLTMPDGIAVDEELLGALGPDFRELGLTNGEAQKLADRFIAIQAGRAEARGNVWGETVSKWADDAKADSEIGGRRWDATVRDSRRFVNNMGTPALREYLEASGGGNHPELIRIFAKAGALIREDDPATGGAGGTGRPVDPAHVLFPNDAPKG